MGQATVGSRYQVVIPSAIRQQLGLRPRSKVLLEVVDNMIVLRPVKSIASLHGIGRDLADGIDATDYIRQLRAEWSQRQVDVRTAERGESKHVDFR